MSGRRAPDSHRGKALDLWQAPERAGEALVCVATSFTFDAGFFETECLGRFLVMDTHPDESDGIAYLVEREEKLAGARVCVMVDRRHAKAKESLRWDVLPVVVHGGGVQHAKLSLLCWAEHVRVIIGSGNLTEPGYRSNVEVFGCLDARREDGGAVREIIKCLAFLDTVLSSTLGDETVPGPRRRARTAVEAVRQRLAGWPQSRVSQPTPVFGGLGKSVFDQLAGLWPKPSPVRKARVLSPFFDRSRPATPVTALARLLAKRKPREIELYPPGETLADGRRRVCMPRALVEAARQLGEVVVRPISPAQDSETRPLHAKGLALSNDQWDLSMFGSSNFTAAGFGLAPGGTNLEANLVYVTRDGDAAKDQIERVWPEFDEQGIDVDDESVLWEPAFEDQEEGGEGVVLPAAFREALYEAGPDRRLLLELGAGLPRQWVVRAPDGDPLLRSASATRGRHVIDWHERLPPFVLQVEWRVDDGDLRAADWPVNVADLAALPPPDELRDLSLEELILVLSSTRPLHDSVGLVLRRRGVGAAGDDPALDPHKRVNTETFLLRRTKRMALALERLRQRLERPACTLEALDWRLSGPLGAWALARALAKDASTPLEAVFFQAELALALGRVRVEEVARGGLDAGSIRERIRACIDQVEAIVANHGKLTSEPLAVYVGDAFEESRR